MRQSSTRGVLLACLLMLAIAPPSAMAQQPAARAETPAGQAPASRSGTPPEPAGPDRICTLIEQNAEAHGLPKSFFARLIWKESRFDPGAISPAGAEGIAQFMPATARRRGLTDSFDVEQAIPASAAYLAELKDLFGNLGLAAAAYNAGENRVSRWLSAGGFLPIETENYVLDITGEAVDVFTDAKREIELRPLDAKLSFGEACRKLPVIMTSTTPMSAISAQPWAVIVAGSVRREAAIRAWQRMQSRTGIEIADDAVFVSRKRTLGGRGGVFSVRIGAASRGKAQSVCDKLKARGGACIVLKNR